MSGRITFQLLPGKIGQLTFDDPNRKVNVLSQEVWAELDSHLDALRNQGLHGLILTTGKPDIFLAGADLRELRPLMDASKEVIDEWFDVGRSVLLKMEEFRAPIIAVIRGKCLGGGLEVALACDGRIAVGNESTTLGLPEVRLSLIPGWGGTQRLTRLIRLPAALDMIVKGKVISAENAGQIGLVDRVTSADQALSEACLLIQHMRVRGDWDLNRQERRSFPTTSTTNRNVIASIRRELPTDAKAQIRALEVCADGLQLEFIAALNVERNAFSDVMRTDEARQAVDDFLNKRQAKA